MLYTKTISLTCNSKFSLFSPKSTSLLQRHTAISREFFIKKITFGRIRFGDSQHQNFPLSSRRWRARPSRRSSFCPTSSERTNCRSMNLLSHITVILYFNSSSRHFLFWIFDWLGVFFLHVQVDYMLWNAGWRFHRANVPRPQMPSLFPSWISSKRFRIYCFCSLIFVQVSRLYGCFGPRYWRPDELELLLIICCLESGPIKATWGLGKYIY